MECMSAFSKSVVKNIRRKESTVKSVQKNKEEPIGPSVDF
jgi:Na+-transporting methylmalonyl-CoA/oxaloacetate decarboxylase gamma subunit